MRACVHVCACESAYYRQWWKEKMRNWEAGDEEKTEHRENNLIVELDGCSSSFLFFICFLFPSPYLPSSRASVYFSKLSDGISQWGSLCMRAHALEMLSNVIYSFWTTACFNVRRAADDWLFPDTGGGLMLMMAPLLLPLITQSSRDVSKTYVHHGLHLWKKLKNKTYTFGTSLLMMFYHKPLLRQTK